MLIAREVANACRLGVEVIVTAFLALMISDFAILLRCNSFG